jgi:peptidoglycan/LPS O-acetylase OafA/YrhL
MEKKHNYTLDFLRGLAAIFVALFHFTNGSGYLRDTNALKQIGKWGYLGVEVFFVISGFIIPLSMFRNNYSISKFKTFILKRIIRIEPPYIITILLVLVLNYVSSLSPYYKGKGFVFDFYTASSILSHIGYLTELVNFKWINPVFWTLGIEFQYYLFIALYFLLITHSRLFIRIGSIVILLILSLIIVDTRLLFHYLPLFTPGIICFLYTSKKLSRSWLIFLILLNVVVGVICNGFPSIIACCIAFAFIFLVDISKRKVFAFLGNISFSLYLIHVPLCMRLLNLSENFIKGEMARSLFVFSLLFIAILIAHIFYKFIEKPFLIKSKNLVY